MKPINPKTTLILAKPGSLIVRAFLISLGLLMSHEVSAVDWAPPTIPFMDFFPEATPIEVPLTYKYGDVGPGGGKVFYLEDANQHGLEAQPEDYNNGESLAWSEAITAAESYPNSTDLDCSDPLRNPLCWHLPSLDELEKLYEQQNLVGGFDGGSYWSSTEDDSGSTAWFENFSTGVQTADEEIKTHGVRSVREF